MIRTNMTPITGNEEKEAPKTPHQALVRFYHAFNTGNLDDMSEIWEQSENIAMDNPLGCIKRGWNEISAVYRKIFDGRAKVYVEFYDYTVHEHGEIFYAVGRERGYFKSEGNQVDLQIRTSRIYRKVGDTWKQTHHHGSIEDPGRLSAYQQAVITQI
jgi:ketosteroid isomerase-like protein